jgi:hypothetical protein
MDLRIGKCPCIVLPRLRNESELKDESKKFQSQLISYKALNEEQLIEILIEIGGIVSVIKDDYDG